MQYRLPYLSSISIWTQGAARRHCKDVTSTARLRCAQGTSSGAPSSTRNVSSILLRTADGACLVDAGEGTCRQLAAAGVPADHVRWCAATQGHLHVRTRVEGSLESVQHHRQLAMRVASSLAGGHSSAMCTGLSLVHVSGRDARVY